MPRGIKKSIMMGEPSVPPTIAATTPVAESTVNIGRSEFEAIMRRMTVLENQNKDAISTETAFKRYSGPKAYKFKTIGGKPVSSLKMTSNSIKRNLSTGWYNEDQRMMVVYADGKDEEMTYEDFVQSYNPSEYFFPIREEHNVKIYFKDSTRKPIIVSAGEYKTMFTALTPEGVEVTNHEIVKKVDNLDKYTFKVEDQDEDGNFTIFGGEEFTVDHTAIN